MSIQTDTSAAGTWPRGKAAGALFVLCGAIFLEGIDIAMLNVALPSIRAELGISTTMLAAIVSAFVLGYAGFMLLGGRTADIFGKRRTFLAALAAFILCSGLGGFASEGWMLLAARFATGIAAAFMTPAGLALITTNFAEGPRRNKALLIYAGTAAGGYTSGLFAGGMLTAVDWRWVFFAPVVLASLIFALTPCFVSDDGARDRNMRFDIWGAITLTGAMLLAAFGITRLENPQEGAPVAAIALSASVILALIFVWIERNSEAPLLRFGILRSASLLRANLGGALLAGSLFGFQFIVTLYLQELLGWSAFHTALAFVAISVDAILAPTVTPWFVAKFGARRTVFGGLVLAAIAYALFLPFDLDWTYAAMFPSMILIGLGFTFAYGPLTILATEGIDASEQGLAGGLFNTTFQFGAAIGLSAASAVTALALAPDAGAVGQLEALRLALIVPVVAALIGVIVTATGLRARKPGAA